MVNLSLDETIAIAVMGATGTGKTTFINHLSDSKSQLPVGDDLNSCTKEVKPAICTINGRSITLIDTPGFDDTARSETEIIRMIAHFLTNTYEKGLKLSGVIYMHRISDNRMGGLSQRNFKMFREMCGIEAAKNVAIVTSMWDEVGASRAEARERELKTQFFKSILDQGAHLLRNENTQRSALGVIAHFLENQPLPLKIQEEIVDEHRDLDKTSAGEELLRDLAKQQELYREEINALKEEMNDMIREKTDKIYQDQQREIELLNTKIAQVQKDAESMAADFQKEREWLKHQESNAGSSGARWVEFARWGAAAAGNMALPRVIDLAGKLISPSSLPPPPPPPGVAAQVLAAVAPILRYFGR